MARELGIMLAAWLLLPAIAGAQALDLDALLGAPFPDAPVAAAQAAVIARSANERGVRNARVARAPDFVPHRLTGYDADDGQALTAVELSADRRWPGYLRGAPGAAGLPVDPANDPDGNERSLWLVATGASSPRRIDAGGAPLFSPDGTRLAFASDRDDHATWLQVYRRSSDFPRRTLSP